MQKKVKSRDQDKFAEQKAEVAFPSQIVFESERYPPV